MAFLSNTLTIDALVKELEAQPPTRPSLKDLSNDLEHEHYEAFTDAELGFSSVMALIVLRRSRQSVSM
jgi:hypothetical protein